MFNPKTVLSKELLAARDSGDGPRQRDDLLEQGVIKLRPQVCNKYI